VSDLHQGFFNQTGSKWRLTDKGREQAQLAGKYIREHLGVDEFNGFFVSDYVRAKETAYHLQLPNAKWKVEPYLRERDYGNMQLEKYLENRKSGGWFKDCNAFYGSPENGESMAVLSMRIDRVLDTLHREYSDKNVIIVCHGETMWGFRIRLERMLEDDFNTLDKSSHPHDRIHNCQILHYTRAKRPISRKDWLERLEEELGKNPEMRVMAGAYDAYCQLQPYLYQMRSICPTDTNLSSNAWRVIERKQFSNDDLLAQVEGWPTLCGAV